MLILPDATTKSRALLDQALADHSRITMLVIGDTNGLDVVASKADVRAQAMPSARRVVWIRDPALLTSAERSDYTKNGTMVACVLNLDGVPAAFLTMEQGGSFTDIELAFLTAQQA